jgi:hypothetical protein
MTPRTLALVLGLIYVAVSPFAANLPLGLLHFGMGAWGIAAYTGRLSASTYARSAAFIFAVLGLMGMVRGLDSLFGLMPLYKSVWLHLISAAAAGFVAWRPESGERRSIAGDRRRTRRSAIEGERRVHRYDRRRGFGTPTAA